MNCSVYARYSSEQQRDTSITDQIAVAREYAAQQGWQINERHIYIDAAVSGASIDGRPGLQALLAAVDSRPPPFEGLLVDDSSRVSRDLADALRIMQQLRFAGVRVIYISQGIDSNSEQSDTLVAVHGLVDGLYLREMASKIRRGLAGQAERGYATGAKTYGFRSVPVPDSSAPCDSSGNPVLLGKKLVIEEREARQVQRIFQWYSEGLGVYSIVERLNRDEPGQWKPGRVRYILGNERYRGKRIWNQRRFERRPGTRRKVPRELPRAEWKVYDHPELMIIEDDLWRRVQARRQEVRQRVPASGRMRGREGALFSRHLFTGFMQCGECGGAITVVTGGHGSPRYGCQRAWKAGHTVCSNRLTVRAKVADPALLAGLQAAVLDPAVIARVTNAMTRQLNQLIDEGPNVRAELESKQQALRLKIGNIVAAIESGVVSPTLLQNLTAGERALDVLDKELTALSDSPLRERLAVMPGWVRAQLADVAALLRDSPERAKGEFRRLGVSFTVSPVRDEPQRPFLRATGTTQISAIIAASEVQFSTTAQSLPRSTL